MKVQEASRTWKGANARRWALAGLAVVAVSVGIGVVVTARMKTSALRNEALGAIAARKWDAAAGAVDRWVAREPRSGEAQYALARVRLAQQRPQEAMDAVSKALDLGHDPAPLFILRAVMQAQADQFDEAEPVLRGALAESDAPQPEVAAALARIYLSTFQLEKAAGPIARWMRDAPEDPRPYLWRNEIDRRRDTDASVLIGNYREALARDPNLDEARLGLADRLRQAHRLDEAADEFAEYIRRKPNDPDGHLGAGRTDLERGRFDDAAKHFDRALELDPREPTALKERGAIELKLGRYPRAKELLLRAVAVDPYDSDTHYNLARALQRLGDIPGQVAEDARARALRAEHNQLAEWRALLVKRPKDPELRLKIADWLLEHGHDDEGLDFTKLILHDIPGHRPTLERLIKYYEDRNDPGRANYYQVLLNQARAGSSP